ncbi:RsmB/NOP family class I SAM-dependent RNA methyltransferase [Natronoglycomyces albus]|uniref:rRNA cytosine-C5-methyltransferase n=1 Tax=Natronoglycomyces albus TaxID=2811108 RepID=A0A895XND2_9ACTN|nr:transcription antitermination factor NusB [Natronoglycomyces albus]QSB06627.1 rRNA cytosine-C5-methyltransferase [Natronoglycomyces albus]
MSRPEKRPRRSGKPGRPSEATSGPQPRRSAKRANRGPRTQATRGAQGQPRVVALETIRAVSERDAYANLVLGKLLTDNHVSGRDAALATELAYGSLRSSGTLDAILAAASGRDVTTLDAALLDVLRLGAYQLLYTRIQDHAAVATTVALAKGHVSPKISGLVNAVLRKVARHDLDGWVNQLAKDDEQYALSLRHAHPQWIIDAFASSLAANGHHGELAACLEADNRAPSVHLCARPSRMERDDLAAQTGGAMGTLSPYAVHLPSGDPATVAAVAAGAAHVQDEGSQYAALALAEAPLEGPDQAWVDLCAGPGGKAALLGSLAQQRGARVDAVEVAEHRATLVSQSVKGLPVTVHHADGRAFGTEASADRVLVDAPCSGLGALRRRPEARWRKRASDLDDLEILQKELLTSALRMARVGGVVAYVTCSPVLSETQAITDWALQSHACELIGQPRQLWPHREGTDAMFVALFRKLAQ